MKTIGTYHEAKSAVIRESSVLKLGIDCAIIQATSHKINVIPAQVPIERVVRCDICFVPRKMRT
jgi:hypothetical protein